MIFTSSATRVNSRTLPPRLRSQPTERSLNEAIKYSEEIKTLNTDAVQIKSETEQLQKQCQELAEANQRLTVFFCLLTISKISGGNTRSH